MARLWTASLLHTWTSQLPRTDMRQWKVGEGRGAPLGGLSSERAAPSWSQPGSRRGFRSHTGAFLHKCPCVGDAVMHVVSMTTASHESPSLRVSVLRDSKQKPYKESLSAETLEGKPSSARSHSQKHTCQFTSLWGQKQEVNHGPAWISSHPFRCSYSVN